MTDAALRGGAVPQGSETPIRPVTPAQQAPVASGGLPEFVCEDCTTANNGVPVAAVKQEKAVKTRYGYSYPINCTNPNHKNDKGYPATVGWSKE